MPAKTQLDDATRVLRDGLNDSPDSIAIADELAIVLMLHGHDKEAYTLLDSMVARHPEDQATQVLYLHILVMSHGDKAPDLANQLIAKYPDNSEVQYLNGVLELRDGNFAPARRLFERSSVSDPNYDHAHADPRHHSRGAWRSTRREGATREGIDSATRSGGPVQPGASAAPHGR